MITFREHAEGKRKMTRKPSRENGRIMNAPRTAIMNGLKEACETLWITLDEAIGGDGFCELVRVKVLEDLEHEDLEEEDMRGEGFLDGVYRDKFVEFGA